SAPKAPRSNLRLYERDGLRLEDRAQLTVPTSLTMLLGETSSLLGLVAFGDSHAVLFTRSPIYDVRALVVKIDGGRIEVTDNVLFDSGGIYQFSAQPLTGPRALLGYRDYRTPSRVGVRLLAIENDRLVTLSGVTFTQDGAVDGSPPLFLATVDPAVYKILLGNTNSRDGVPSGDPNLKLTEVTISGASVAVSSLENFGSPAEPFSFGLTAAGNFLDSIFVYRADPSGYRWGRISDGTYSSLGRIPSADGLYAGEVNMAGAANLKIGLRSFFRLAVDSGTRIFLFDGSADAPKVYNTAFPRSHMLNTVKLFSSGDTLILVEPGFVRTLSTP
ncbi:MAG: hypothetical protein HC902_13340, partial [Calothrix sp. SM1_5_4]|nr:hypothetical protein [Calothrix sp. SM1_5_4]